ncbi:agmatine deiminase family protein [Ferrimonas senticii]|uniref:agmatine deiminase family protein n=1 Tax=Ferrimonas senticii TaxID=394566 RepID=UPI0003FC5AFD|nr:agmatine deiminase family protein [Ferrimonas senticii]
MNAAQSRWTMPAEWQPHRGCYLAWPCRQGVWGYGIEAAKRAFAEVIAAIAQSEPVTLMVNPAQLDEAKRMVTSHNVTLLPMALDDSWARDITPLTVFQGEHRGSVDFRFNCWGEKFSPYHNDAASGAALQQHVASQQPDFAIMASPMVLEGGSIHVDGEGTLLTTAECLLNPNRNPNMTQAQIEQELCRTLGVDKVLWLPHGVFGDVDTDGHVDNIATFTRPGRILTMGSDDRRSPNFERYQQNAEALASQQDAQGRTLELIAIPEPEAVSLDGEPLALSYINYYLANDAIIVPAFGQADRDQEAARIIQAEFPEREVIAIDALPILGGGGGIHCITMQEPR